MRPELLALGLLACATAEPPVERISEPPVFVPPGEDGGAEPPPARSDAGQTDANVDDAAPSDTDASGPVVPETDAAVEAPDLGRPPGPDAAPPSAPEGSGGEGGAYPGLQRRQVDGVEYFLYVPGGYDPNLPAPLLGLFHGQGGDPGQVHTLFQAAADADGFLTLAIGASGAQGGWVGGQDTQRFSVALNDAVSHYNVDLGRLYLWGFSAGAHFVHGIGLDNTDLFAGYAVAAGSLAQYAGREAPGRARRHIPLMVHIGQGDPLYAQAVDDRAAFTGAGWVDGRDYRLVEFDGGHETRPEHAAEAWQFLRGFRLPSGI